MGTIQMTIRVLLVDDHSVVRQGLRMFLGLDDELEVVGEARNGVEAVRLAQELNPDVVLMDIRLPGMNGVECVGRLREILPSAKAVMLTAYEDDDDVFRSLAAGAFGYLVKRVESARLREAIREAHRGGSPISGSVARKLVEFFQQPAPDGADGAAGMQVLSPREGEIVKLLAEGHAYKQIADILHISVNTICTHIKRIYEKLHVHSRTEAVRIFQGRGKA